ncbi:hypothetical protein WJX84_009051 [Apatococcus fuscideae]|uniref:MaoC-like domain-containing protein n=1 Tax=Apatococcus fuscideae TaxID=2026836 RepID=A0AAW1SNU5_9CHLO
MIKWRGCRSIFPQTSSSWYWISSQNLSTRTSSFEAEADKGLNIHASRHKWSEERHLSAKEVASFCHSTGDFNPIHCDLVQAQKAGFEGMVIPGLLVASMFPAIIAAAFPGAIYLSQTLKFRHPAVVPADIKATVTFVNTKQGFTEFNTVACEGQTVIVDGTAKALLPKQPRAQLAGES